MRLTKHGYYYRNRRRRHFHLFLERSGENYKASKIEIRPSKGSCAIFLLRKRKLKMCRQNKREGQISLVLMCKLSHKKQIWARQIAFENRCILLLVTYSSFVIVKAVGEESGNLESASRSNLLSFTYEMNRWDMWSSCQNEIGSRVVFRLEGLSFNNIRLKFHFILLTATILMARAE